MKDLIAKLEAATEGSRELDAEIARAVKWRVSDYIAAQYRAPLDILFDRHCPDYTTSIDAALTLVPEGHYFDISDYPNPIAEVWKALSNRTELRKQHATLGEAPTPALALCIAALKARG